MRAQHPFCLSTVLLLIVTNPKMPDSPEVSQVDSGEDRVDDSEDGLEPRKDEEEEKRL